MKPVLVVGPHRSGTSVTTRVVSLLGPSLCVEEDLMTRWDNPAGHWESDSLTRLDDELLSLLGGTWYAPPELGANWPRRSDLDAFRKRAVEQFFRVYPASDWVWKDPRLCLLLPFWTSALAIDPVIVLTVRNPLETARSLRARDPWGEAHALAIWEWYVAAMLVNCSCRPVVVMRYEALLSDTHREVRRLRDALDAFGVDVTKSDISAATRFVDKRLRHHRGDPSRCLLNDSQERMHGLLVDLDPCYSSFPHVEPPDLAASTVELIAAQRRIHRLQLKAEGHGARVRSRVATAKNSPTAALEMTACRTRDELTSLQQSDLYRRRYVLEVFLARQHQEVDEFSLPGFCLLDDEAVSFRVDRLYSPPPIEVDWLSSDGETEKVTIPNWRERMICPTCGMNNRQRAMAAAVLHAVHHHRAKLGRAPHLYLTEQVTPMYRFFDTRVAYADCIGSELLDPETPGGTERDGLRHENVEALSFEDASMDVVVCCSVLEHVNEPLEAVHEMARILRPDGELFLEVPFDTSKEQNTRRARIVDGEIEHLLPPVYHGDPMSSEGTLVFTDFGWEFVDQIRASGLLALEMCTYWSLELGHLGGVQLFFHARRTTTSHDA